mmetsp:Transcript_5624/g.10562  ORF Transcript_5624/g.10562 Transcript_5624/m.10562 type:complete len:138 (+) Transcript_5624:883-1296(+)
MSAVTRKGSSTTKTTTTAAATAAGGDSGRQWGRLRDHLPSRRCHISKAETLPSRLKRILAKLSQQQQQQQQQQPQQQQQRQPNATNNGNPDSVLVDDTQCILQTLGVVVQCLNNIIVGLLSSMALSHEAVLHDGDLF